MINGTSGVSNTPDIYSPDSKVSNPNEAQDRFLKLLVAQLNNQDPMNPMDNAQMTSQMAQINTVTGIQQLNQTMQSMASQFSALQVLQGTAMIGRTVLTEGKTLAITADGKQATAAFDLQGPAADVKVQITTASGELVGTVDLGECGSGRNYFTWDPSEYQGELADLRFSVLASNGATTVAATPLSPHAVIATGANNGKLTLELDNGQSIDYGDVKAVY